LTVILAISTLIIGYNQYKISKKQRYENVKNIFINKYVDSIRDINGEVSELAKISRDIIRKGFNEKRNAISLIA